MLANELQLVTEKTEAVILKGRRKREDLVFDFKEKSIIPKKHLRYSGVHPDHQVTLKAVTAKENKTTTALVRLMRNIGV